MIHHQTLRFDGETVVFLALVNGDYQAIETSIVLPIVTPAVLQDWLIQATAIGETSWAKSRMAVGEIMY